MKIKALIFMILIVSLGSCLKDSETFVPNDQIGNIENLLTDAKKLYSKETTIDAGADNTIITENLDIIIIPANMLLDSDNKPVVGSVVLKYKIDKSYAMEMLNKRNSTFENSFLSKYFSFDISFTQNNKELHLDTNKDGIDIMVPYDNSSDNQHLSAYQFIENKYLDKTDKVNITLSNWKLETQSGTIFGSGFKVVLKREGEWLIGERSKSFEKGNICIQLPENYSSKNTVAYALFPNKKLLINLVKTDKGFCSDQLPIGELAKIITLSEQEKIYYVGEAQLKVENDAQQLNVVPSIFLTERILELLNRY